MAQYGESCEAGDNTVCMWARESVQPQHMVIMPPSKAEDSCTVVKTVENRKGPLKAISL